MVVQPQIKEGDTMDKFERTEVTIPCPGCRRDIETTYQKITSQQKVKCIRCQSQLKFKGSDLTRLKSAIKARIKADSELNKWLTNTIENAEQLIK